MFGIGIGIGVSIGIRNRIRICRNSAVGICIGLGDGDAICLGIGIAIRTSVVPKWAFVLVLQQQQAASLITVAGRLANFMATSVAGKGHASPHPYNTYPT